MENSVPISDTERLNFMFEIQAKVHETKYGYWVEYIDKMNMPQWQFHSYETPRQAIDALMEALNK